MAPRWKGLVIQKNNHSNEEENQYSDGNEEKRRCPWNIDLRKKCYRNEI
jgi:hypothetical protein